MIGRSRLQREEPKTERREKWHPGAADFEVSTQIAWKNCSLRAPSSM
jgi:hypothetical protein